MTSFHDRYAELIALTQLYLFQEYGLSHKKIADFEVCTFFRNQVIMGQKKMKENLKPHNPEHEVAMQPKIESLPQHTVNQNFKLEPLKEISKTDLGAVKSLFPQELVIDATPDGKTGKKFDDVQVAIVSFGEIPQHCELLEKIAEAIQTRLNKRAKVISAAQLELAHDCDSFLNIRGLQLILAPNTGIQTHSSLKKKYQETKKGNISLGGIPVLLLSDLSLYINEPKLKAVLWKELQQRLV